MLNKALRILIADEQHFHRMKVERLLNQLGYFRIAPVSTVEELLSLVEYGCEPFDLLLISASMTAGFDLDLLAFCVDNEQIRRGFIYDGQHAQRAPIQARHRQKIQVSLAPTPDFESLRRLMRSIDPRTQYAEVPVVPWLRDACQSTAG
ncbi:response regulator [Pseudomonas fluorescens]|uniref:Chemotaxis protein CheY n=1 Tax=Pseudomonas fluorescens TaxID=294 RepID=A0A5E7FE04_PSEFL|nr:response regulator [Pseudomonas fluorescens]VVO37580.1 hypothetical protein PS691_05444 [Pseudomonas fluorescens]